MPGPLPAKASLMRRLVALCAGALLSIAATAGTDVELEQLRDKLAEKLPDVARENIRRSPVPGLYEVQLRHLFGYVSADGRFLVSGDMVDLDTGTSISELHRRATRQQVVRELSAGAIEFAPPPAKIRYTLDVFVDVDCNYCRQMHAEIDKINAAGIRVRYLFFPRGGPDSETYKTAVAVWCSANRAQALTQALNGREVKAATTACDHPVLRQYSGALEMGVKGTPIMVLPNGELLAGYVSAQDLLQALTQAQ